MGVDITYHGEVPTAQPSGAATWGGWFRKSDPMSEEIQDLRDEVAGLRRKMAALRRGVIEELDRLREALG